MEAQCGESGSVVSLLQGRSNVRKADDPSVEGVARFKHQDQHTILISDASSLSHAASIGPLLTFRHTPQLLSRNAAIALTAGIDSLKSK